MSCEAVLARDNRGRSCSPCDRSGKTEERDREIVSFALGLHPFRQRLGVLGLDYAFYHGFLNEALKNELRELRRRIYRHAEPPRPLNLVDASRWAASVQNQRVAAGQVYQAAATLRAAEFLHPPEARPPVGGRSCSL